MVVGESVLDIEFSSGSVTVGVHAIEDLWRYILFDVKGLVKMF